MEVKIEIDYSAVRRQLAVVSSKETAALLNKDIGTRVVEKVKDHLDEMSVTRHKVAERLGVPPSRYFEYASGRIPNTNGQKTVLESSDDRGSVIAIKNTPGLVRAFHDLEITPKRARALTIPLNRISARKRVRDLEREGHEVFRPKGTNILAETKRDGRLRPLYALVRRVVVPKDEGLLPTRRQLSEWATEAAEAFFEARFG